MGRYPKRADFPYTEEEWSRAYKAALKELGMPERGPLGSKQNYERVRIAAKAVARARQILNREKGN
jgi:hypothetical protein